MIIKWNDFFYRISELMLPALIQRYDKKNKTKKKHFIFDLVQKRETNWNLSGCKMPHFMIVLIPYVIFFLNLSWIKMSIFEKYGAFECRAAAVKRLPILHYSASYAFISFGIIELILWVLCFQGQPFRSLFYSKRKKKKKKKKKCSSWGRYLW